MILILTRVIIVFLIENIIFLTSVYNTGPLF